MLLGCVRFVVRVFFSTAGPQAGQTLHWLHSHRSLLRSLCPESIVLTFTEVSETPKISRYPVPATDSTYRCELVDLSLHRLRRKEDGSCNPSEILARHAACNSYRSCRVSELLSLPMTLHSQSNVDRSAVDVEFQAWDFELESQSTELG